MATTRHTAFISGGGRNIGRAIALELARRGVAVVVNGRSDSGICEAVAAEVRALGVDAMVAMGDVGDGAQAKRLAAAALERFGTVDILVNNAAIRPHKPFLEMPEEEWHRVIATDLHSSFHLSRAFLPGMIAAGWGRIVNLTGMNAMTGDNARAAVATAKHGLLGLTKALAREFGPKGITVNAISPGPIRPDGDTGQRLAANPGMLDRVPLGRMGEPDEVAAVCGLLCSDEGAYVTGQMIAVNGGGTT